MTSPVRFHGTHLPLEKGDRRIFDLGKCVCPLFPFTWGEAFWLVVCAGILVWKLFLPGFIGMADNSDFGKVTGPLGLASAEPEGENFFHPLYLRGKQNCYNPDVPTSERWLAWLASTLEQTVGDRTRFDIRWLGAIHSLIFLAFYYSVLILLRPLSGIARFTLSLLALWIFADIGLIAYFNSFESDVPAALGGLATALLAVHLLAARRLAPGALLLFGLARHRQTHARNGAPGGRGLARGDRLDTRKHARLVPSPSPVQPDLLQDRAEFGIASLADACETPRHLLMFHVFTDVSVFLGLVFAASVLEAACPVSFRRRAFALVAAGVAIFVASILKSEVFSAAHPVEPYWNRIEVPAAAADDTSPAVVYSGNWGTGAFRSAFRGTLTFSDEPGAVARFSFEGTELLYIYTKAFNRGMALVTIDGSPRATIDLYDPQIVWQARTVFGGLKPGPHHAEIQVLGRRNSASSGDFIDIDALMGR
jgi:hypothetical protein